MLSRNPFSLLLRNPRPLYYQLTVSYELLFSSQIFVGKIPRDLFEDELVPLFEKAGPIWDLRLMMDPLSGLNRGYAFVTFCTKEAAQEAVKLVSISTSIHLPVLFCWVDR